MTMKNDKFIPKGKPLTPQQLEKIALFQEEDLKEAIARAHPSLKPYLQAQ